MTDFHSQFRTFINDLERRLLRIGINLEEYAIDHACFRVRTIEEFEKFREELKVISVVYSEAFHNERQFLIFILKRPLIYDNARIYTIEFAEPGGSDAYETGFQHIEILTNLELSQLSKKPQEVEKLLFHTKNGEVYIKWEDKVSCKTTNVSVFLKQITEDGGKVI